MADRAGDQVRATPGERVTVQAAPAATGNSGASWCSQFPTSSSVSDLAAGFQTNVQNFLDALQAAGASVSIAATLRPPERAFLMHWSWLIVKQDSDARAAPKEHGIDWWWGDQTSSKAKAQEMVDGYQIGGLNVAPSLTSRHIEGNAIDMNISWSGTLTIKGSDGTDVAITTTPRDGTNSDLISVGAGYGVIHFTSVNQDKPHWSTDGH